MCGVMAIFFFLPFSKGQYINLFLFYITCLYLPTWRKLSVTLKLIVNKASPTWKEVKEWPKSSLQPFSCLPIMFPLFLFNFFYSFPNSGFWIYCISFLWVIYASIIKKKVLLIFFRMFFFYQTWDLAFYFYASILNSYFTSKQIFKYFVKGAKKQRWLLSRWDTRFYYGLVLSVNSMVLGNFYAISLGRKLRTI